MANGLGGGASGSGGVTKKISILYEVEGQKEAEAAAKKQEQAQKKLGEASKKAGEDAAAASKKAGDAANDHGGALNKVTGAASKFKVGVEAVGSALGVIGAAVGIATLAFVGLKGIFDSLSPSVSTLAANNRLLTEEMVKNATGLGDLSSAMGVYARSIGVADSKLLSFLQKQAALKAIALGEIETADSLGAELEKLAKKKEQVSGQYLAGGYRYAETPEGRKELEGLEGQIAYLDQRQQFALGSHPLSGFGDWAASEGKGIAGGLLASMTGPASAPKKGGGGAQRDDWQAAMLSSAQDEAFGRDWAKADSLPGGFDSSAGPGWQMPGMNPHDEQGLAKNWEVANEAARAYNETLFASIGAHSELGLQFASMAESQVQGFAEITAGALLFGDSIKKGMNGAFKALALLCTTEAMFSGAKALVSLAFGDFASASLYGQAAAIYTGAAIVAGGAAAATGGLRPSSGKGAGSGVGGASDFGRRPEQADQDRKMEVVVLMSSSAVHDAIIQDADRRRGSASGRAVAVGGAY